MTRSDLLALAERCEKSSGPDRELELEVARALGKNVERNTSDWGWFAGRAWRRVPAYTSSIDAAMTLVPEGCRWNFFNVDRPICSMRLPLVIGREAEWREGFAATLALALCAAALKARAAKEPKPNV